MVSFWIMRTRFARKLPAVMRPKILKQYRHQPEQNLQDTHWSQEIVLAHSSKIEKTQTAIKWNFNLVIDAYHRELCNNFSWKVMNDRRTFRVTELKIYSIYSISTECTAPRFIIVDTSLRYFDWSAG